MSQKRDKELYSTKQSSSIHSSPVPSSPELPGHTMPRAAVSVPAPRGKVLVGTEQVSTRGRKSFARAAFLAGKMTLEEYRYHQRQMQRQWSKQYYYNTRDGKKRSGHKEPGAEGRRIKMEKLVAKGKTLQEVGELFGVTRERVRQIVGNVSEIRDAKKVVEEHSEEILSLHAAAEPLPQISSRFNIPPVAITANLGIRDNFGIPLVHGTIAGYLNYRCRCEACKEAYSEKGRKYYQKQKKKKAGQQESADQSA